MRSSDRLASLAFVTCITFAALISFVATCTYPASQGPSEPCDPALGVDACGAGLVCAALDGREQPSCYAERSRADTTECTEDVLCASGDCNEGEDKCRSSYLSL